MEDFIDMQNELQESKMLAGISEKLALATSKEPEGFDIESREILHEANEARDEEFAKQFAKLVEAHEKELTNKATI